jgi:ribosomal protein S18 acetylase RimI-like enzyme
LSKTTLFFLTTNNQREQPKVNIKPTIRQATMDDRAQLEAIIGLSFPRFFRYFASYSLNSEEGKVLVAVTQGTISGFAKLIEFNIGLRKYGCILWIAVHPSYRRRGIAFSLTNAGTDYLKRDGAQMVFVSTQRRNTAALATLGKAGFMRIGFVGLWRFFGWRVFVFYRKIWYAPSEIVLMRDS